VDTLTETDNHHNKIQVKIKSMIRSRGRVPITYVFYGLGLFIILLAVLFPYKRLAGTLLERLEARTGIDVIYKELGYTFPLGFTFEKVEVVLPQSMGRFKAYRGETLTVKFSLLSFLKKSVGLNFSGISYGGKTSGQVRLPVPVQPDLGSYRFQVEDVRYEEIIAPFYLRNFKISGRLTGEADFQSHGKDVMTSATGNLHAALTQGKVRNLYIKGMDLPDFDFQSIQARASLAEGKLVIEDCQIRSDILEAEIKGELELNARDFRDSSLHLTARLKPMEEDPINLHGVASFFNKVLDSQGYYPFTLQGTFRYPELQ